MEAPATPPTARRRGFAFFGKGSGSSETSDHRTGGSGGGARLSYQPRIKGKRSIDASTETRYSRKSKDFPDEVESGPSTPRACVGSRASPSPKWEGRRLAPHRLHLPSAATKDRMDNSRESGDVRELSSVGELDADQTPKGTPKEDRNAKRRQTSLGLDGLARWSEKHAAGLHHNHQHARKASWSSRETPRRRVSSPLEVPADMYRKLPIAGAKPVAPSYHPDAPPELKVRTPSNAVLLPFLSIPGNSRAAGQAKADVISPTSPSDFRAEDVIQSTSVKHQRPGIKVRIITWNQGNSVPKGDLEVLLGRVGEYIAPQEGWDDSGDEMEDSVGVAEGKYRGMGVAGQEKVPRKERIPPLPHDDAHPYHIIVVAGQECPWGDGKRIATGVGLAGELGDLSRSKSRAAQMAKEKREAKAKEMEERGGDDKATSFAAVDNEFPFAEGAGRQSVPSTPLTAVPSTPGGAGLGAGWGIGGKGWSDMCEDWLCRGPLAQATATKGLAQASKAVAPSPLLLSPAETPEASVTPAQSRATTPIPPPTSQYQVQPALTIQTNMADGPATVTSTKKSDPSAASSVISQDQHYKSPSKANQLAIPRPRNAGRSISFASRSKENLERPPEVKADESEEALGSSPATRPVSPLKEAIDMNTRIPAHQNKQVLPGKAHHRLGLHIPGLSASHHITVQSDGTPLSLGAYELVAKERCYMMYMAVYVWRGCLDRVCKTSQGHVKSGLLAGRVGNKGAVGISLKLGSSRLLFVNAHLAAHEGKVAERIANVEKIKAELKVDTFLPPEDPRNKADDVTEAFDFAFWFGDLNFRVDISRQHADWLLMKKQYQDALAFDQLKKVMKEQPNVFKSFHEASITFPPTFKYDVLKTIKQKREEKSKKHKSSSNSARPVQEDKELIGSMSGEEGSKEIRSIVASTSQSSVKQGGGDGSKNAVFTSSRSRTSFGQRVEFRGEREGQSEALDDDTSSVSSSTWGGSALSTSAGQASDREDAGTSLSTSQADSPQSALDPVVSTNTAAAEGHALHGRAIKVKQRILGVVNAIGGHSPHKDKDGHLLSLLKASRHVKQANEPAAESKSNGETEEEAVRANASRDEVESDIPPSMSFSPHARTESSNSLKVLGQQQRTESSPGRQSVRRRRSSAGEISPSSPTKESWLHIDDDQRVLKASTSMTAMLDEYEKQPYDTSAKQRVPSWCDRVLWKSNIVVEVGDDDPRPPSSGLPSAVEDNFNTRHRKVTALSQALHPERMKWDKRRSISFAANRHPSTRRSFGTPLTETYGSDQTSSRRAMSPRRRWFHRKGSDNLMKRSATFDHGNVESPSGMSDDARTRKRTMSAVELPITQEQTSPKGDVNFRRSRNSLHLSPKQLEGVSPGQKSYFQNSSNHYQLGQQETYPEQAPHALAASTPIRDSRSIDATPEGVGSSSARKFSWWSDLVNGHLPSLFTPSGAMNALSNLSGRSEGAYQARGPAHQEELVGPRRGEVDCLLYKSLDDREMRLLEGRSDHRPVIWVGSIGV